MMIGENKSSITNPQKTGVEVLSQSTVSHHHYRATLSLNWMNQVCPSNLLMTLFMILAFYVQPQCASAKAKARLEVQLVESDGIMNFVFIDRKNGVQLDEVQVEKDLPNRLKFTIDGHRCQRAWQKSWRAKGLKRALLYPSKKQKKRCFLKVKMKRKITNEQIKAISKMERAEEGVLLKFSWDAKSLSNQGVELIDESGKNDASAEVSAVALSSGTTQSLEAQKQEESPKTVDLVTDHEEQTIEPQPVIPAEVAIGDFADMEVNEDQLGIQERPHSVIETVIVGQIEKARAYSPAPVILSGPIAVDVEGEVQQSKFLGRASLLLTKLLDREALSRGGSIWVIDPDLREQITKLNTNIPKLSLSQEKSLANHVGAQLISRAQLTINKTQGEELSLAISMSPVYQEGVQQDSDPGIYRVQHSLSKAMIEEALAQTWVEYKKDDLILRSLILPGWGQIHQGDKRLGWTYLSSSIGLALGAILSSTLGYIASQDYQGNDPRTAHRRDDANAHYDRANLLWFGLGTVYLTSAIDAVISSKDRSYLDLDRLNWNEVRQSLEAKRSR